MFTLAAGSLAAPCYGCRCENVSMQADGRVARAARSGQTDPPTLQRRLVIDNPTLLERTILESIPLARAMEVSVLEYDGNRLALSAPLGCNVNDKGCAFGGSMASLMTLAGWGLINLKLGENDCAADVFIADSTIAYMAPLWDELIAEAAAEPGQQWETFITDFRKRGRARISIAIEMTSVQGGAVVCRMNARFVAKSQVH